ncbi:MAG: radical SAM protein, partial [Desulfobacteraceae bacterium]|nr:radical SAM protein [Desulfobacteraceae bacterium]
HDNLCSYYDVPVQHAASSMLKRMGRPYTREDLIDLFKLIRKLDPEASLRTTLIVGFPGETKEEFEILKDFIHQVRFDHLGVFTYSDSDDLKSHGFKDHVPEEIAEERHDILMAAQAKISEQVNERHVGKIYPVFVEENPEQGVYIGRTQFQAPEVDGMTFIYSQGLEIGTIVHVRITDAYEYDIAGEIA